MAGWLEILVAAATLQLLVLPGEKVQLIIAGLSTKYNPYVVVAGAGIAFAAWTALEIVFGRALQRAVPGAYLDAVTGGLFLLFGLLLLYSAHRVAGQRSAEDTGLATDGGVVTGTGGRLSPDRYVPERYQGFVAAFSVSAFGEFGDKTQLVTIGLAVQYGASSAIWLGEMLVIIPLSLLNAVIFHKGSHTLTPRRRVYIYLVSAALFLLFAADTAAAYLLDGGFLPI
jgi:putative Ca2+/H+ antiporter (TMEM165/GDT1 family)